MRSPWSYRRPLHLPITIASGKFSAAARAVTTLAVRPEIVPGRWVHSAPPAAGVSPFRERRLVSAEATLTTMTHTITGTSSLGQRVGRACRLGY